MFVEIALILLFILDLALAAVVYLYNTKGTINRFLSLLLIPITLSNLEMLLFHAAQSKFPFALGYNMAIVDAIFFYPIAYIFTFFFPRKTISRKNIPYFIFIFIVPTLLAALYIIVCRNTPEYAFFSSLFGLGFLDPYRFISPDSLLSYATKGGYFLYIIFILGATTRRLILSLKKELLPKEKSLVYLFLGGFIPLSFILLFNYSIFLPIKGGVYFYLAVSSLYTLYFVILTIRFGFLDRKAIVRVFIVSPLSLFSLFFIYKEFLIQFNSMAVNFLELDLSLIISLEVVLFVAVFPPLIRFIVRKLGSSSAEVDPDFRTRLKDCSSKMVAVLEVGELYKLLRELFIHNLGVRAMLLFLEDEREDVLKSVRDSSGGISLSSRGELAKKLLDKKRILTLQQLALSWGSGGELNVLDSEKIQVIVPLIEENRLLGICCLGDPGIARPWHPAELEELELFFSGVPVVLSRCRIFSQAIDIEKKLARIEKTAVLSEITSSVAHELRNPISIIYASAETLVNRELPRDEVIKFSRYIHEETGRVSRLLNKILSFGGKSDLIPEKVDVIQCINRTIELLLPNAESRGISLESINEKKLPYVYIDREGFLQVCMNLTLNALEAVGPEGFVRCVAETADDRQLSVRFINNGPPIPEENRKRIFEPFFTTKVNGTGLGLPVSQRIMRESGGDLRFISSSSVTIFEILLPLS